MGHGMWTGWRPRFGDVRKRRDVMWDARMDKWASKTMLGGVRDRGRGRWTALLRGEGEARATTSPAC